MADEEKPVDIGALLIDARAFAEFLVDLPRGTMQGMRTAQPGFSEVVLEIVSNQAACGAQAGITTTDFDELTRAKLRIGQIDALLPAAIKVVELLRETRAKLDDQLQRQVSAIAQSVEGRAKAHGKPELLAKYEKTRAYRSAIGLKAAKTRRRIAEESISAAPLPLPASGG